MTGKQPLHNLDNPSGYISPAVYPPMSNNAEGAINDEAYAGTPATPVAKPGQGYRLGGITFPFRFSSANIGINAWRAGSI
jgi:hypothetical protein